MPYAAEIVVELDSTRMSISNHQQSPFEDFYEGIKIASSALFRPS